jgi:antitoxin (DNA-binding transcriptional repressor) of toxin-antitoxin stability system
MKKVGIREFRDNATTLMAAGETLVIERNGKPIGFFVPIEKKDPRKRRETAEKLGKTIEEILASTGMTEDELVEEFMRDPWPKSAS